MADAIQVASLFATLSLRDEMTSALGSAKKGLSGFADGLTNLGGQVSALGGAFSALSAPLTGAFEGAVSASTKFNESMTNVQSVTQASQAEMDALSAKVLEIGTNSRYGGNQAALAMYEISSGVADASTHMAILEASIHTAQAGNAGLAGTTAALVSVMNSYGFSADKAGYASDVLSRTVAVGVGSMDEFAAALPLVTGYAKNLDISFADLGAQMAFMTTKGFSANQAGTQLRAMMLAALNPNERMKKALKELGFSSGEAAIKQLGLVGAMKAISGTSVATTDGLAAILGSSEALTGAMALLGDDADTALSKFTTGLEGATAAAEAIQMQSAAAQFDLARTSMEKLSITAGDALKPALTDAMNFIQPIVSKVIEWVQANPQLVLAIGAIVSALATLGPILGIVGSGLAAIGTVIGVIASPIGIVVAAIAALALAFSTNFMGIRDAIQPVIDGIVLTLGNIATTIQDVITAIGEYLTKNPEFTTALVLVAGAVGVVSAAFAVATTGVGLFTGAVGVLLSPIVLITAAMAALLWTINEFYPGGFSKLLSDAATSAQQLGFIILFYLNSAVQWIRQRFEELIQTVQGVIDKIKEFLGLQGQANISGGIVPQNGVAPAMMPNIMSGGFASGGYTGDGPAGEVAGMVHRGEWVVPRGGALVMEGGGDTYNVTVYANSAAEGRAAADSFEQRIRELKRSRS